MNSLLVLAVATVLLAGFAIASLMVLRADRYRRRVISRRMGIAGPYTPAQITDQQIARLSITRSKVSLRGRLKRLAGMDAQRRDPYPLQPVIVVPIALLIGWVARWLLHGLLGSVAWCLIPAVAWFTTRSVYTGLDAKRAAKLYRQFPDALATIVRAVRVGIPVTEAIRAVAEDAEAPTSVEFERLYDQIGIGAALEDALHDMAARNHLPEYRFFATALALQSQTGGGLTETLENLAEVVRKRVALKARGYALAAEARTSAAVLAALPVFAGAALVVMSPAYVTPLLEEGPGQTLFGGGVAWLGLGLLVMRAMIRRSLA